MHEANGSGSTDRFDSDPYANVVFFRRADFFPKVRCFLFCTEANFLELLWKLFFQKIENLFRVRRAGGKFDACVNVFRVFAEDHHVHFFRMLKRRGDASEVLHRPQANEKIEELSQRNVKRTNPSSHRCGQWAFDPHVILAERLNGIIRQPFTEFVLCCLAGENLKPRNFLSTAVRFFDCGIEHALAGGPDVRPGAVSADKWNDRLIRHI